MNFEAKYKKYKQKYLELQKQTGGHQLDFVGSTGQHQKIVVPLELDTASEIFELPRIHTPPNMFIPYRSERGYENKFTFSNTFYAGSNEILNSIRQHIIDIPEDSWIACVRYEHAHSTDPADCQIGVSGSVNLCDVLSNGLIDLKNTVKREINEECGLDVTNDIMCNAITNTTDIGDKHITYMVSRVNISNATIVPTSEGRRYLMTPESNKAEKLLDIQQMKVWCIPFLSNDEFEQFKIRLNENEDKNLHIIEPHISSIVFIRRQNLLGYLQHFIANKARITGEPVAREQPVGDWKRASKSVAENPFDSRNRGTYQPPSSHSSGSHKDDKWARAFNKHK